MGIQLTNKRILTNAFVFVIIFALSLGSIGLLSQTASAAGEAYTLTDANTIQGKNGSFGSASNKLYATTTQSGTTQVPAAIGTLTFTKASSGAFVSNPVKSQWQSGATTVLCEMRLSISLSGTRGTLTANPIGNYNAATCLNNTGLTTSFTVANTSSTTTPTTSEACRAAGGTWEDATGSGAYRCSMPTTTTPENNGGAGGAGADEDTADTSLCNDIPVGIRWAACPVTELLQAAVDGIDNALHAALDYDTKAFDNAGYRGAWEAFRTIGLALIVIAGLMIVIGQAAGIQILDAYTIKKAVPRLFIAVIFIALSWPLMELVVTFVNDIGGWVEGIIEAPFSSIQTSSGETVGVAIANWGIIAIIATIIAGGFIAGMWPVIFSFLVVGVVAVLAAMIVVGIRTALITLCIGGGMGIATIIERV